MNVKQVQQVLSRWYPLNIRYQKAKPVTAGTGKQKRRWKRIAGISTDKRLSVHLVGPSRRLDWLEFMIGLDDAEKAAACAYAVEQAITAVLPDWKDQEWLKSHLQERRDGQNGRVRVRFSLMATSPPLPVAFVRVGRWPGG
jgi:hypothetical protein